MPCVRATISYKSSVKSPKFFSYCKYNTWGSLSTGPILSAYRLMTRNAFGSYNHQHDDA